MIRTKVLTMMRSIISTAPPSATATALAVEVNLFRHTYNTLRPHQALDERTPRAAYLAVEHCDSISVWPLADPLLDWEVLT
jgi:transposase InsO family protein